MYNVLNLRALPLWSSNAIQRIDRSTPFGNPFHITSRCTREQAIARFTEYWLADEQEPLRALAVQTLRGHDLACWCAPLPCHGDVLMKWLYQELG